VLPTIKFEQLKADLTAKLDNELLNKPEHKFLDIDRDEAEE